MNREIKFRGWDVKARQFLGKKRKGQFWKISLDGSWLGKGDEAFKNWEEEIILEQYTGLKDKNGKEIYEGDIVVYDGIGYEYYWDEMLQGFNVRRADGNQRLYGSASYEAVKFGSVVGNIHENPELLKG